MKHTFFQPVVTLLLLLFPLSGWGQEYILEWSEANQHSVGQIIDVFPKKGFDFYAYHYSGAQFIQSPRVTRFERGEPILTKRIEQRVGTNVVTLQELVVFNETLLGFLSDKKDGTNELYMVRYDSEIDPIGEPELVASYSRNKGETNHGFFNVLTSRNKRFMCVEYMVPGKRAYYDRYGYKILDTAFNVVTTGEYEIPYESRFASVDLRYLTDNGDYILGVSVRESSNQGIWRDNTLLKKTVVVHIKGDHFSEYELAIEDKRVFDIGLNSVDSMLVVSGTYGEEMSSGAQGVFMMRINLQSQQVRQQYFKEFPREFMISEMTLDEIDRLEQREDRGRLGPQLYNYAIRNIFPLDDGSTVVVAEQLYVYQQTYSDMRGVSQTVSHYYFNDLIVYRITADGTFNWMTRIPKEQYSVNDYGFYSSIRCFTNKGRLVLFFNDNLSNYDEKGMFMSLNRSISFPARKKSYTLAKCEVDLENGETFRRSFNDYVQAQGFVVPRLSSIDHKNRQVLFYGQGKTDRFGILQF